MACYRFGSFLLNSEARTLSRDGTPVAVTGKSLETLALLLQNRGKIVTKDELLSALWPDTAVEEANLTQSISTLRKALGENPKDHRYIVTIPGRGYEFVGAVIDVSAGPRNEGRSVSDQSGERTTSPSIKRYRYWIPGIVALLLIAFTAFMLWEFSARTIVLRGIDEIAVLPFENLSGEADQDYVADGITEGVISEIGKIGELTVISRSTVMKYRRGRKSMSEIAKALNVNALVEGAVLRSGQHIRITAQLIAPVTNRSLWSGSYEGDLSNAPALQANLARDIAKAVRAKPVPRKQWTPVRPEAYDYYLRGKFLLQHTKPAENSSAIYMLKRATEADPSFAAAYAAVAWAYADRLFFVAPESRKALEEEAYVAVEKAIALDPNLADAYVARCHLLWTPANHFPHERAIKEARRAVALNPNSEEGHRELALLYNHTGLFEKAREEAEKAAAIDPSSPAPLFQIGHALLFQGKYEAALRVYRSIPEDNATPEVVGSHMAWGLLQLGKEGEARSLVDRYIKTYPGDPGGCLSGIQALLFAVAGDKSNAEKAVASASEKKNFGHFHHAAYWIASAYARMNDPKVAMEWLEETEATGFSCYPLLLGDPNLDGLRNNPRFLTFVAKSKQQWEYYKAKL